MSTQGIGHLASEDLEAPSIDGVVRPAMQRQEPILVENGKVIGMLSIGDLVKAVIDDQAEQLEQLQRYISG